ncbi:Guanine nucleotide-binding protein G(o) subunit alpha [Araneus ventricosus]|uniref:Guanine nucleotide-binding protein G(O) subunit alpha n=1 Tax=Araneus ventricosus TaxID=182803 RepID=A0A4Y2EVW2_ARAVE|nr:Guanine nucleotide-binding protein G(o) subunit alpha [Araneus ventricosus]
MHSLMAIIEAMPGLGLNFESEERRRDQEIVSEMIYRGYDEEQYSDGVLNAMKRLWNDDGVKQCYNKSQHYQLSDNIDHFLDDLDRLAVTHYRPSTEDILLTRIKTTGIVQIPMSFHGVNFRIFDVGGQKAERKKWINCFDNNVSAVIFCTAISEYDQTLSEDEKTVSMLLNQRV